MGKIKKILENELIGGTQSTDVYPVTSTQAVYDENNRRLSDFVFDKENVINDLTTGGTDKALSAEMGKELSAELTELGSDVKQAANVERNIPVEVNFITEQSLVRNCGLNSLGKLTPSNVFRTSAWCRVPEHSGELYVCTNSSNVGNASIYNLCEYDVTFNFIQAQKGNKSEYMLSEQTVYIRLTFYTGNNNEITDGLFYACFSPTSGFKLDDKRYRPVLSYNNDIKAVNSDLKTIANKVDINSVWNLVDPNLVTSGYINASGNKVNNAAFLVSDYCILPAGTQYIIFKGHAYGTKVCHIAVYDTDRNFLKSQLVNNQNIQLFDISDVPAAKYMCYSVHKNSNSLRAEVASSQTQESFLQPDEYNPISGYINEYHSRLTALENKEENKIKKVVCWGDSLTANGSENSYPNKLQALLGEDYIVNNYGIGGDTTSDICCRCGSIVGIISKDFTMPGTAGESFTLPTVNSEDGEIINYGIVSTVGGTKINIYTKGGYFNSKTITPITIGNCKLEVSNQTINGPIVLTTLEDIGADINIKAGTPVIMNGYSLSKDADIIIVCMGANGGYSWDDNLADNLVKQFSSINTLYHNKVIFLTPHTVNMHQSMRDAMVKAFGVRYIDMRDYFSSLAIYDAIKEGLYNEVTEQDLSDMSAGNCPNSLLADGVHFNDIGRTLLANLVYKRMKILGYVD